MKKQFLQTAILRFLFLLALPLSNTHAQSTVHNPTFSTTNQSWYKPGTSSVRLKNYLLDGQVKGFASESIGDGDFLGLTAKMGIELDIFTDATLPTGGQVDVSFPARISYSYPTDRSYGCGEEIPIATTCSVNAGYNLNSRPPSMDVQFGVKAKAGLYLAVESFFGDGTAANEPAGFNNATLANYESLMAGGEQTLLQYNTVNGVGIASENWISSLPVTIPFPVSFPTKLNGTLSQAFQENPADAITGKIIQESVTRKFMDLDYDPIQYSSYITGVRLKVTAPIPSVGTFSATLLSAPLHFDVFQRQTLTFSPEVNIQMQLNRNYNYRVRDENNTIVQTGTGNSVNMKAGHTLLVTVPTDNQPIAVTPTYHLDNEFTTEINYITNISASVEMFAASAQTESIEICDPTGILDFFGLEEYECNTFGPYGESFGPLVNIPIHIDNAVSDLYPATTFSMGGFQDIPGATLTLRPDDQPPVVNFTHPVLELDANGQVTVNSRFQVANSFVDADGGGVVVVNEPTTVYTCADLGTREYVFVLRDNRCNEKTYRAPVTIVDRIRPTITCPSYQNVQPATAAACTAVLPNINADPRDNCSTVLTYELSGATVGSGNGQASGLTFNSAQTTVTYRAVDPGGNTTSCAFVVNVSSCANGRIIWKVDNNSGVKDVTVALTGDHTSSALTGANGVYGFIMPSGSEFTLTPSKNLNKLNGVNAQDCFRFQTHLAGNLMTDPWQLIAADANSNGVINNLDLSILQNSILGNPQAQAQMVKSWRFIPTNYAVNNPPWGFPESISLTGVNGKIIAQDFYGIKVGDITTVSANPANSGKGQPFVMSTPDQVLQEGNILAVDLEAAALSDITALQFALRFNPDQLQLADIATLDALPLTADHFGTHDLANGSLRMLWAGHQPVSLKTASPMLRLQFEVLQSGSLLSEVLHLDDETLTGHVYNSRSAESGVSLRFNNMLTATPEVRANSGVQLLQNRPNPFRGQTTIAFVLPEACEARLRIVDAGGRVVAERTKQYTDGQHEEAFDLNAAPGVLYYELTTPFGVQTKKMTKVE